MEDSKFWCARANAIQMQADFIRHAVDQIDAERFSEFLEDADLVKSIADDTRQNGPGASAELRSQALSRSKKIRKECDAIYRRQGGNYVTYLLGGVAQALKFAAKKQGGSSFEENVALSDAVYETKLSRGLCDYKSDYLQELKWQRQRASEIVNEYAV